MHDHCIISSSSSSSSSSSLRSIHSVALDTLIALSIVLRETECLETIRMRLSLSFNDVVVSWHTMKHCSNRITNSGREGKRKREGIQIFISLTDDHGGNGSDGRISQDHPTVRHMSDHERSGHERNNLSSISL